MGTRGLCWYPHPLSCEVQVKERILLCVPLCWSPKLSTEKYSHNLKVGAFQVALVVKKLLANMGNIKDMGSIPGLGRSSGGGPGKPLQGSCRKILWTEEPVRFYVSDRWVRSVSHISVA